MRLVSASKPSFFGGLNCVNGYVDAAPSLIELAEQTLHVRLLGDALPPVSHLEDTIAAFSVSAAREANAASSPAICGRAERGG